MQHRVIRLANKMPSRFTSTIDTDRSPVGRAEIFYRHRRPSPVDSKDHRRETADLAPIGRHPGLLHG